MDALTMFLTVAFVLLFVAVIYLVLAHRELRREVDRALKDGGEYRNDTHGKIWEVKRMLHHLADHFGLQYEVRPEQGRWRPSDPMQQVVGSFEQPTKRERDNERFEQFAKSMHHSMEVLRKDTEERHGRFHAQLEQVLHRDLREAALRIRQIDERVDAALTNLGAQAERLEALEAKPKRVTRRRS